MKPTLKILMILLELLTPFEIFAQGKLPESRHVVFDVTGGHTGYGDVTGPLWVMLNLKERLPKDNYSLIVDPYSKEVLKTMFRTENLEDLGTKIGAKVFDSENVSNVPRADQLFELFVNGRELPSYSEKPYTDSNTVTVITEGMHNNDLSEIRVGKNHFYFNPIGMGSDRSGVMQDPIAKSFMGKSESQAKALIGEIFTKNPSTNPEEANKNSFMKKLVTKERFPDAKLGLIYGPLANIKSNGRPTLTDQLSQYLAEIKPATSPGKPVIILAPNKIQDLAGMLNANTKIWTLKEFEQLKELIPEETYLVSTGPLEADKFTATLRACDLPVLVEGNSTVSAALRMNVPFINMASPWNAPQIKGLHSLDEASCQTDLFKNTYDLNKSSGPILSQYLPSLDNTFKRQIYFAALNLKIPDLANRLTLLLNAVEESQAISKSSTSPKDTSYINLAEKIKKQTKDLPFAYSLIVNAVKNHDLEEEALKTVETKWKGQNIEGKDLHSPQALRAQFQPKEPKGIRSDLVRKLDGFERFISKPDDKLALESIKTNILNPNTALIKRCQDQLRSSNGSANFNEITSEFIHAANTYAESKDSILLQDALFRHTSAFLSDGIDKKIHPKALGILVEVQLLINKIENLAWSEAPGDSLSINECNHLLQIGIHKFFENPENKLEIETLAHLIFTPIDITDPLNNLEEIDRILNSIDLSNAPKDMVAYIRFIFKGYFKHMSPSMKRSIVAELMKEPDSKKWARPVLQNSGPLMQKLIQQLGDKADTPEARAILNELKSKAPPMSPRSLEREKSLAFRGQSPFFSFNDKALASATIGEVHSAYLKDPLTGGPGEEVILKFLKPKAKSNFNLERSIIENIKNDAEEEKRKPLNQRSIQPEGLISLLDAMEKSTADELSFDHERSNLILGQAYRKKTKDFIEVIHEIKVPGIDPSKVLVLSKAKGVALDKLEPNLNNLCQLKAGFERLLIKWLKRLLLGDGFFHGDLHAGNIFFEASNDPKKPGLLTLIDFGNAGSLNVQERTLLANLVTSIIFESKPLFTSLIKQRLPDASPEQLSVIEADYSRILATDLPINKKISDIVFAAYGKGVPISSSFIQCTRGLGFLIDKYFDLSRQLQAQIDLNPTHAAEIKCSGLNKGTIKDLITSVLRQAFLETIPGYKDCPKFVWGSLRCAVRKSFTKPSGR